MLINISPVASGMRTEKSGNDVQHLMCLESIFWNLKQLKNPKEKQSFEMEHKPIVRTWED